MITKKISLLVLSVMTTLSLQANDPFFSDPFGDDIFKEMMQMQQNMDTMFNRMHQRMQQRSSRLVSPLGTYQLTSNSQFIDKGNQYELLTSIPENKENQIDITLKEGVLSIRAKIIEKYENKSSNGYSSSRSMRMYQQSMAIPADADESTLTATYQNKKLVIRMNKKVSASMKPSPIKIEISKEYNKSKAIDQNVSKAKHINGQEDNTTKKIRIKSDNASMS